MNTISTLADIQFCKNLQELYIRKNRIPDISEICWLRDLPRLRNLWLEENPCAEGDPELSGWTQGETIIEPGVVEWDIAMTELGKVDDSYKYADCGGDLDYD